MNNLKFLFVSVLLSLQTLLSAQQKVGIVLSGGGAKGLAHIGFLKALDEHHIKVDFITGTSMGAIVGGLYAMGYSGLEIEKIAKSEDWESLMSNYIPMSEISIEEKSEYQKFIGEFPIKEGKLQLPASLLRGQKLENRLTELTMPAYDVGNFDSLPIPFRCLATNIVTGKEVVLNKGSLGRAMRASMGMPTLFRPIHYEGNLLIDGGLVRNFPVHEVVDMGANFVIGSYVGTDLYTEEELQSFDKVILQIGNFNDFYDVAEQKKLCNLLVEPKMDGFSTMSFESVDSLINSGYKAALKTLNKGGVKEVEYTPVSKLPFIAEVKIDSVLFEGINRTDIRLLSGKLRVYAGDTVTISDLEEGTARIFGTRNFEKVTYRIEKKGDKIYLIIEVIERDNTFLKFALSYNNEIGAALIVNTTFRNILGNRSRALVSMNIAENPRLKLDYFKYFGPKQNLGFRIASNLDYIEIPLHDDDNVVSIDRYAFLSAQIALQSSFSQTMAISTGVVGENVTIKPNDNYIDLITRQSFSSIKWFGNYEVNTMERRVFPAKGILLDAKYLVSFNARSSVFDDNLTENLIGSENLDAYSQLFVKSKWNIKASNKLTFLEQLDFGLSFDEDILYTDNMFIGGLPNTLKNTISFPGMRLYEEIRSNFASFTTGVQYEVFNNTFLLGRAGLIRFGETADFYTNDTQNLAQYEFGGMIGVGYRSVVGPIYAGYARNSALNFGLFNLFVGYDF